MSKLFSAGENDFQAYHQHTKTHYIFSEFSADTVRIELLQEIAGSTMEVVYVSPVRAYEALARILENRTSIPL